ncbi:MAG: 50S ribosomal protein L15 [Ignavibacteria bacterium]|nr:50S ribosomal protein L15 [Ignavibacteria bacterium]
MDVLSNLKYASGSIKKRKRVGRGVGSGHGKTSCRGSNGQKSRAGAKYRSWFEGGQMPLQRRIPKRGFTSPFRKEYQTVNLTAIEKLASRVKLDDNKITIEILHSNRVVGNKNLPIKILGDGEMKSKLTVEANAFSKTAQEKIEAAGGKITIVE